jgi:hypothetical protein
MGWPCSLGGGDNFCGQDTAGTGSGLCPTTGAEPSGSAARALSARIPHG